MVRPHAVPLAALICLYLAKRKLWSHAMCLALGVAVFLVPWVIRNENVLGSPVFLATESGETLLGANNPYVYKDPSLHGMWLSPLRIPEYVELLRPVHDEVERSRVQTSVAVDYLRRNPRSVPLLAYYKLVRWLTPLTVTHGLIRLLVLVSYGSLLLLLLMGAVLKGLRALTSPPSRAPLHVRLSVDSRRVLGRPHERPAPTGNPLDPLGGVGGVGYREETE